MTGEYIVQMDEKFRISLPSEFKDELAGKTRIIAKSLDTNSLQLITLEKFEEIENMLKSIKNPEFDSDYLALQRHFIAPSTKIEFDKTLRIMIPRGLRKHAEMEPKASVTILGLNDKIEIWNSDAYDAYSQGKNVLGCLGNIKAKLENV